MSSREGVWEQYIVNSDGSEEQMLTSLKTDISKAHWGKDNRIYFGAHEGDIDYIFSINPDGSDLQKVSTTNGSDFHPKTTSDNSMMVFVSYRDKNFNLYSRNLTTGTESRLLDWSSKEDRPDIFNN